MWSQYPAGVYYTESCSCLPASHRVFEGPLKEYILGISISTCQFSSLGGAIFFPSGTYYSKVIVAGSLRIHSSLPNVTPTATNVHVMLRRFAVLTWMMRDNRELVEHVTLWNNTKSTLL